ncbi:MAG: NACHT domain-containing protein [Terriglobia bacterium]|jgi:hypothetical protein
MDPQIEDQVVDFYYSLFGKIFTEPFKAKLAERLKRDAVGRQIQDAAGAASQSLTRFLLNERLTSEDTARLLQGFEPLHDLLQLEDVANPSVLPEALVSDLLPRLPCPSGVKGAGKEAVYGHAMHSVVQVLKLVGPVMAEWQRVNFSASYEPSRQVINKLNQISEQLGALGTAGQAARDETYELTYRDYLLQRFHRIEAGTVRMTTSQDVSLAELFVMPRVLPRRTGGQAGAAKGRGKQDFMSLAAARERFAPLQRDVPATKEPTGASALDQVRARTKNVIVGAPGGGKSTFLEWLQLKLASGEEALVMAGAQAIPLLLRVRQLDPQDLPRGAALIEKATASKDIAALMPEAWIEGQMRRGRVFFMLDGLDEVEPETRDSLLLPWFLGICREYPRCRYLVSSRPEGYPLGTLRRQRFVECDLLDFEDPQVLEYTRHWCTAVRLARNEAEAEARREGAADGERIVAGFKDHPYTRNLARNPLMLSAICLVNYFEGGQLPKDRAVLYRLCVEGLLHNWDQRRGISSEFGFDEKLRACREVAVTMQADDRAEYEAAKVQAIFTTVLGDPARAERLLEHIRRRTGLLLERRPGAFAFAHLTFQEYLAARAVHEGNRAGVDVDRLLHEHNDGRWKEVIALYCGLAPTPAAREMIEKLMASPDSEPLASVLTEAYLAAGAELSQDSVLRHRVIERISVAPVSEPGNLGRFLPEEVAPLANLAVGTGKDSNRVTESCRWLEHNLRHMNETMLLARLRQRGSTNPMQAGELFYLLHAGGSGESLAALSTDSGFYATGGPRFSAGIMYASMAEVALEGLSNRPDFLSSPTERGVWEALLQSLRVVSKADDWGTSVRFFLRGWSNLGAPPETTVRRDLGDAATALCRRMEAKHPVGFKEAIARLSTWAESLERGTRMEPPGTR